MIPADREIAWIPAMTNDESDRAYSVARRIAQDLVAPPQRFFPQLPNMAFDGHNYGLGSGSAGIALFYAQMYLCTQESRWAEAGRSHALRALQALREIPYGPGLFGGVWGILHAAWTVSRVVPGILAEEDLEEVEGQLRPSSAKLESQGGFDLISGLVGIGVYCLGRNPSPVATRTFGEVVSALRRIAVNDEHGSTWIRNPPRMLPPFDGDVGPRYDMGVAHGSPGVAALLGLALCSDLHVDGSHELLRSSVDWILAHRIPDEMTVAFSLRISLDGVMGPPARTAWCYGDPGVGLALLYAGIALRDVSVVVAAREILRRASRIDVVESKVDDTPVCHGASGLAHVFSSAYQVTGDRDFLLAAQRWYRETLIRVDPTSELGGVLSWRAIETGRAYVPEGGYLTGAAGVGASLLNGSFAVWPVWDRPLLTYVPRNMRSLYEELVRDGAH